MQDKASQIDLVSAVKEAHRIQVQNVLDSLAAQTQALSPYDFEKLVLVVLRRLEGVQFGKVTQRSRDGGIDGYVSKDAIGRFRVPFQAKRTIDKIGSPDVQRFSGAMLDMHAKCGFFVTTSRFSPDAQRCELVRKGLLTLIDGIAFLDWMYQFEVGVTTESSITLKIISPQGLRLE